MQIKHKLNRSLFILGLTTLLFVAACPLVQAQTSPNDIVFYRRTTNSGIYTMKADGSNQTNLTNGAASDDTFPDWSPDGSRIVFRRNNGIWIMNADGGNRIQLTNVSGETRPSWSPDGSKIAFAGNSATGLDIFVMNADGSNRVRLTTAVSGESNNSPRWSPDGTKIAFFAIRSATGSDQEIYVMNADGTNQTAITNNDVLDVVPDWSPDNSKIAFTTNRDSDNLEVYVMNADGSNQTRITNNPAIDAEASWSPDGTKLAFVSNRDGNNEIYTMNADGSNQVRLTNNTVPDEVPRWKPRRAAPGDLDTSYGNGGKVVTPATANDDVVQRVRVQSDGKIVTLGLAQDADLFPTDSFIVRHNANGTLDTSFGTNGVVLIRFNNNELLFDFMILPDGRLLIVGRNFTVGGSVNIAIFRYLANGTRDASFGTNGVVTTPIGDGSSVGFHIALQPDGKFVVLGRTFSSGVINVAVARYNADGTLDSTFGTNGIAQPSLGAASSYYEKEILVQNDGKLLVAGYGDFGGNVDLYVLRLNTNGTLDSSFGAGGIVHTDVDNLFNTVGGMVLQPDGKIVINSSNSNSSGTSSSSILRYNQNGTLDTTFGANGIVRITELTPNAEGITLALAIQQNGKILTAGIRNLTFAVARYNPNGTIDTSFGTNGVVITTVGPNGFDRIYSLAVQPDGKIVAAGGVNNAQFFYDVVLVRYLGDAVSKKPSDFDGDGRSDLGVFRPSNGVWYENRSMQSFYAAQFGIASDKPAPADYDGDGKIDIAVFREGSFAYFYILNSSSNTFRYEQFGQTGDSPIVVGDWDGDGKADPSVYRASTTAGGQSFFYYRPSAQPGINFIPVQWGTNGDEAVRGDFDGDGKMDAAVFRPGNQSWYIRNSSSGAARTVAFGASTDKRVPGDFDGDGKTDIAVFRPGDGSWYILQSASNQILYVQFGLGTDTLVPADYDGDGKTDVTVFRNGIWYIRQSAGGIRYASFGASGDVPIASVFVP